MNFPKKFIVRHGPTHPPTSIVISVFLGKKFLAQPLRAQHIEATTVIFWSYHADIKMHYVWNEWRGKTERQTTSMLDMKD